VVDARDLDSRGPCGPCAFDSRSPHPNPRMGRPHLTPKLDTCPSRDLAGQPLPGRVRKTSAEAKDGRLAPQARGPPGGLSSDAPRRISPANTEKRGPAKRKLPGP